MKTVSFYRKRASAKARWSANAARRKAELRLERALSPQAEPSVPDFAAKIKPAKFDVRINLERKDGERIQSTCHRFGKKLYVGGRFIAPKQFGRNLGQILNLWSME